MESIKKQILKKFWQEIGYVMFAIVYCIKLHLLNRELERISFSSVFELLQYREYKPLIFFALAIFFVVAGVYLIVKNYKNICRKKEFEEESLLSSLHIILILLLIITIAILINNPIFRAVLIVTIIGGAVLYVCEKR